LRVIHAACRSAVTHPDYCLWMPPFCRSLPPDFLPFTSNILVRYCLTGFLPAGFYTCGFSAFLLPFLPHCLCWILLPLSAVSFCLHLTCVLPGSLFLFCVLFCRCLPPAWVPACRFSACLRSARSITWVSHLCVLLGAVLEQVPFSLPGFGCRRASACRYQHLDYRYLPFSPLPLPLHGIWVLLPAFYRFAPFHRTCRVTACRSACTVLPACHHLLLHNADCHLDHVLPACLPAVLPFVFTIPLTAPPAASAVSSACRFLAVRCLRSPGSTVYHVSAFLPFCSFTCVSAVLLLLPGLDFTCVLLPAAVRSGFVLLPAFCHRLRSTCLPTVLAIPFCHHHLQFCLPFCLHVCSTCHCCHAATCLLSFCRLPAPGSPPAHLPPACLLPFTAVLRSFCRFTCYHHLVPPFRLGRCYRSFSAVLPFYLPGYHRITVTVFGCQITRYVLQFCLLGRWLRSLALPTCCRSRTGLPQIFRLVGSTCHYRATVSPLLPARGCCLHLPRTAPQTVLQWIFCSCTGSTCQPAAGSLCLPAACVFWILRSFAFCCRLLRITAIPACTICWLRRCYDFCVPLRSFPLPPAVPSVHCILCSSACTCLLPFYCLVLRFVLPPF